MNPTEVTDLLLRLADDELIMGHRNSEWTAIGPILEEDIAFASMAQDELGHAQAYYLLVQDLNPALGNPDQLAFGRTPLEFKSCQLVEAPIGDYAFSLIRQALYDLAEDVRLHHLMQSSYAPLAALAQRLAREEKYHLLHAHTWLSQLCRSEEGRLRLQSALNEALPMAYSLFEPTSATAGLASAGVQPTEQVLAGAWLQQVHKLMAQVGLQLPSGADPLAYYGGRRGYHSDYLAPLLQEMREVFVLDPAANW